MNYQTIIQRLIKVADHLDREGQTDLVDQLDQSINELSQVGQPIQEIEVEVPPDERELLEAISQSLQDSLS